MRLIAYFILAYVAIGVQVGLSAFIKIGGAPPNLVLLAAVFIALNAPKEYAMLGCFGLGLFQDLLTQQALGIYALSYGLLALLVIRLQQLVYREHILTHLFIAFCGSIIAASVIALHDLFRVSAEGRTATSTLVYATIYTTALSPIVVGILQKMRRRFGFHSRRGRLM